MFLSTYAIGGGVGILEATLNLPRNSLECKGCRGEGDVSSIGDEHSGEFVEFTCDKECGP